MEFVYELGNWQQEIGHFQIAARNHPMVPTQTNNHTRLIQKFHKGIDYVHIRFLSAMLIWEHPGRVLLIKCFCEGEVEIL
jgi:hypothetical protein